MRPVVPTGSMYLAEAVEAAGVEVTILDQSVPEICAGLDRHIRAAARVDTLARLGDETWRRLRDVGFIGIGMGVESGSTRARRWRTSAKPCA